MDFEILTEVIKIDDKADFILALTWIILGIVIASSALLWIKIRRIEKKQ